MEVPAQSCWFVFLCSGELYLPSRGLKRSAQRTCGGSLTAAQTKHFFVCRHVDLCRMLLLYVKGEAEEEAAGLGGSRQFQVSAVLGIRRACVFEGLKILTGWSLWVVVFVLGGARNGWVLQAGM